VTTLSQQDTAGKGADALPPEPGQVMPREQFEQIMRDAAKAEQK
jgi:hypothetical protein